MTFFKHLKSFFSHFYRQHFMFSFPIEWLFHYHKIYTIRRNFKSTSSSTINSFSFNTYPYAVSCDLEEKEISWTLTNSRLEPVHGKKAWSLLDRLHLFSIQNKGDGSLQHAIERVINIVEGITIHSKKTNINYIYTCLCCTISSSFLSGNVYISW